MMTYQKLYTIKQLFPERFRICDIRSKFDIGNAFTVTTFINIKFHIELSGMLIERRERLWGRLTLKGTRIFYLYRDKNVLTSEMVLTFFFK